jgi:hypothetical protein
MQRSFLAAGVMPLSEHAEQLTGVQSSVYVFLSDGQHQSPACLAPDVQNLVDQGELRTGSIVDLKEIMVKQVRSPLNEIKR